jgi:hypothetical protein
MNEVYGETLKTWQSPNNRCPRCDGIEFKMFLTPSLSHYSAILCVKCNKHIKWYTPPEIKPKKKRTINRLKPEIEYCELCLRHQNVLPDKCVLQEHHIIQYSTNPELDEVPENRLVLCTFCHEMVHLIRKMVSNRTESRHE